MHLKNGRKDSSAVATERPVFGRRDPDRRGYFGAYGGRFVPETLVAPIEELDGRLFRGARGRRRFATSSIVC